MRLGVARKHFGFNERVDKLMNDLLAEMKTLGAVLVDPADIPTPASLTTLSLKSCCMSSRRILNAISPDLDHRRRFVRSKT
jgi:hypothetical protein